MTFRSDGGIRGSITVGKVMLLDEKGVAWS